MRTYRAVLAAIVSAVGPDEIHFWLGLALLSAGLWMVWAPGACLAPGLVLVWVSLPTRAPFVARSHQAVPQGLKVAPDKRRAG